ncbi:hypothetical protein [Acetobacter conturbans]|uniref:Uncharacterized protein n=1 Tax=Acetobacter conturbans TaxID=1737472 RepID=A0ABX0JUJ5_9PROT|nr:hypothetical protein [Acetobacter conturbans]NHN87173.1 hypothetical protein [Acetobacter conturbans]
MLITADIVLFLSLVWPFLAGAIIAIFAPDARTGEEDARTRFTQLAANFSVVSFTLSALNVPLSLYLSATAAEGVEFGWMVEMPLATIGCLLLHAGLVSQCFAPPQPEEDRALVARDTVPFWTTGLLSLAMLLEEPVARAGMLLSAPILAVILLDTGAGRGQNGWNTLRRTATGALLVFSGFLHPNLTVEGILAALGFCLLAGLFPAALSRGNPSPSRPGNAPELLRAATATLAVAALLATFPLPPPTMFAFRGTLFVLGLATLVVATLRLRLSRAGQIDAIAQASLGLAAIAAGVIHPLVADLALLGPLLATPWLAGTPATSAKATVISRWLLLLPGFCALLCAVTLVAGISLPLTLLLIAAALPALRPVSRLIATHHAPARVAPSRVPASRPNTQPTPIHSGTPEPRS